MEICLVKLIEGVKFSEQEKKMGWRSQPTCEVIFNKVRVPAANLVGEKGKGLKYAMQALLSGRIAKGACSLGAAQCAFDMVTYTILTYFSDPIIY